MDPINMFHVLAPAIRDIGHGVRLSSQNEIASKTLVCFLDGNGGFHFGFGYKNGGTFRVVCWENDERQNKTVPKGVFIIAFHGEVTQKGIKRQFVAEDFTGPQLQWFNDDARQNAEAELRALNDKQDGVADLIERIAGLTIQQIDLVNEKIDELQRNN